MPQLPFNQYLEMIRGKPLEQHETEPLTRAEIMADCNSELWKAAQDEPLFILRASDPLAGEILMHWVKLADQTRFHNESKRKAIRALAYRMMAWKATDLRKRLIKEGVLKGEAASSPTKA